MGHTNSRAFQDGGICSLPATKSEIGSEAGRLMSEVGGRTDVEVNEAACLFMCRFSDAGMTRLSTHCGDRRLKSAKARNRGKWGHRWCRGRYGDLAAGR